MGKILDAITGKDMFYTRKNLDKLLAHNAMYHWIYGGRNNGKSYVVKNFCLEDAWKNDRRFGLLFRFEKTVARMKVYFNDSIRRDDGYEYIKEMTNGQADGIDIKAGEIFFTLEGKKVKSCGNIFFLEHELQYKSEAYSIHNIIYEEVISTKYLIGEIEHLDSFCSTIFRTRTDVKVFLIGNLISRVNPYRSGWGLTGVDKQKEGTTDVYKREGFNPYIGQITYNDIVVERCKEYATQTFALSKKGQQNAKGAWETEDYMQISKEDLSKCLELYKFVFTFSGFNFMLKLFKDKNNNYFLYCERKTTNIQPRTRVIGDIDSIDVLYTPYFTPLVEREKYVFSLIKLKKIYFCDNLTGADFWVAYNTLNKM